MWSLQQRDCSGLAPDSLFIRHLAFSGGGNPEQNVAKIVGFRKTEKGNRKNLSFSFASLTLHRGVDSSKLTEKNTNLRVVWQQLPGDNRKNGSFHDLPNLFRI